MCGETAIENNQFSNNKHWYPFHAWSDKAFKGTVVNWTLSCFGKIWPTLYNKQAKHTIKNKQTIFNKSKENVGKIISEQLCEKTLIYNAWNENVYF